MTSTHTVKALQVEGGTITSSQSIYGHILRVIKVALNAVI